MVDTLEGAPDEHLNRRDAAKTLGGLGLIGMLGEPITG